MEGEHGAVHHVICVARASRLIGNQLTRIRLIGCGVDTYGATVTQRSYTVPPHFRHGIGIAIALEADRARGETLAAMLTRDCQQLSRRHRRRCAARRRDLRRGTRDARHHFEELAVECQHVEDHHHDQRQAEECTRDGKDQVERQAEQTKHIVRVHPETLEVAARPYRKQVLLQAGQVQDHPRHQRQAVQHGNDPHEVHAIHAEPERVVQGIEERRQLARHMVERRFVLRRLVSIQALAVHRVPFAGLVLPVRIEVRLFLARQADVHAVGCVRMHGNQLLHEGVNGRAVHLHFGGVMTRQARRVLPDVQFVMEDRDRAREECDEQRPAGHQADPGMKRVEHAQGIGFHANSFNGPEPSRRGALRSSGGLPRGCRSRQGCRRSARAMRRDWSDTAGSG